MTLWVVAVKEAVRHRLAEANKIGHCRVTRKCMLPLAVVSGSEFFYLMYFHMNGGSGLHAFD